MFWIIFGTIFGLVLVGVYLGVVAANNDSYAVRHGDEEKLKVNKGFATLLFLVPVILFTLLASMTRVATGEIAVMTRFGRVTGQELGEGLHLKNPVDKANKYDTKVLKIEADAAAASNDLQDVKAKLVVNYELEGGKVSRIHQNVGKDYQLTVIDPAIQEVFKASSARYTANQLINEREKVKNEVVVKLRERLSPDGIFVKDISLVNFQFSPEFTNAIEAKQVAQQQAEQAKFNAQKAEQDAQADINRAKGQAEAQRLLRASVSADTIELKRLEIQSKALDKWNGTLPSYYGGSNPTLFNIPIK